MVGTSDVKGTAGAEAATVVIADEQFEATPDAPFVFGRSDADGVVGLDSTDMGISGVAGSVESAWGVWWLVNQSTKRPLLLEHPGGPAQLRIAPGHRHALTTDRLNVLVPGAIYTHVLEVLLPAGYVVGLRGGDGRLTTGTLATQGVNLSDRERDALSALCAGYLESFPRRREHPNTYEDSARLLGDVWTSAKVRKAVERVKGRFAAKQGLYFEGPQANYELAGYLISNAVLSGEDLVRLAARDQR